MRHLKAGRKLGRNATHRLALMRNLARALILSETGRITTTLAKAKALRPFVEKLITFAKRGDLHARRLALAKTHDREVVQRLFAELGPRFADRPGGYTRVIKRHERRLGDAGFTAFIELLKQGETKTRARVQAPAPAPRVREPEEETPSPPPAAPEEPTGEAPTPAS